MDAGRYDLWRYADLYTPWIPPAARLTLGEGWTPAEEAPAVATRLGLTRLVLKREECNPTGSHKARGLALQVSAELAGASCAYPARTGAKTRPVPQPASRSSAHAARSSLEAEMARTDGSSAAEDTGGRSARQQAAGRTKAARPSWLVISSSGNAALAAAAYCAAAGARLAAFVAPRTRLAVVRQLVDDGAHVFITDRAIRLANETAQSLCCPNLRPSTHALGAVGYQSIAWELVETTAPVDALFTFVTSGSSFVGIGQGFARGPEVTPDAWSPALHAVQGCGACPIAGEYDARRAQGPPGRLGALGAKKTRRLGDAKRLVGGTGGSGWVVTDAEALAARRILAEHGVDTSLEGCASLAAAARSARESGVRSAVVVLTGRSRGRAPVGEAPLDGALQARLVHRVDHVLEVLRIIEASEPGPSP